MLTQVEVEDRIVRVMDELEQRTEQYDRLCIAAAEAEADYRRRQSLTLLSLIERKMTVQEREARTNLSVSEQHSTMLITAAARNSCRESLSSLRETLNALRTLAASLRQLT